MFGKIRPVLPIILVVAMSMMLSDCRRGNVDDRTVGPRPTENRLDRDAESRNRQRREEYFEMMHRAAPGVDWREIEKKNGLAAMERRRMLLMNPSLSATGGTWRELGSRNQAGRMHCAGWSADGTVLYAGSDRGGLWMGDRDGTAWAPLGDNLYGGVYEVGVVPGEGGGPDILIRLYGDMVNRTTDLGVTWSVPAGLDGITDTKRILVTDDAHHSVFLLAKYGFSSWKVMVSVDGGASFSESRQLLTEGDIWTPRDLPGPVYLEDYNKIYSSTDQGRTWTLVGSPIPAGVGKAILAGSEYPVTRFNVAVKVSGTWELWRSEDTAQSWYYVKDLDDFWESLVASSRDGDLIAYAGVEMFVSRDGGSSWDKVNDWWAYYDDPANMLHADIPGLYVFPDSGAPTGEVWYIGTDGGLYDSNDQVATVRNLSMSGLGVSQYYSVLTSRRDPNLVLAGAQDQGYQRAVLTGEPPPPPGPWADFDQLISGDYGHLTSSNGTHDWVYSVYPGFVLVQQGEENPDLSAFLDFPSGESYLWMPYIQADPMDPEAFYFCARHLYRYHRVTGTVWNYSLYSAQDFSPGYLTAIAFSPLDPGRAWAATSIGNLYYSNDGGVTWTQSADTGPSSHYFYGTALLPSSTDLNTCWVGGSGYSTDPVFRTTDGGATWQPERDGLPSTLVYCLAEAPDESGVIFCGSENGAWSYDPVTRTWSNILGTDAPINTYWACEAVPSRDMIRFGTYGRGIWDYSLNTPGYFPYGEFLGPPNVLDLRNGSPPRIGRQTTFTITGCVPGADGVLVLSTAAARDTLYGGTLLVRLPGVERLPFQAGGDGTAAVTLTIPNDQDLVGSEFYLQAGSVDPGQVDGRALSNGLRAVVGGG